MSLSPQFNREVFLYPDNQVTSIWQMRKDQYGNGSLSDMDVDPPCSETRPNTTTGWPWQVTSPDMAAQFILDDCHREGRNPCDAYTYDSSKLIGSAPPRDIKWIADVNTEANSRYADSISSVGAPNPSRDSENNNFDEGVDVNRFPTDSLNSKANFIPQEGSVHQLATRDHVELSLPNDDVDCDVELSARVQGLELRGSNCKQPIIVYEDVDTEIIAGDGNIDTDDDGGASLAVPAVDVREEKKRPPLPEMNETSWVSC